MSRFLDIPPEVIYRHLMPYLRFNDLLRLRRLCKTTKSGAEDYLENVATTPRFIHLSPYPDSAPSRNLSAFLGISFLVPVSAIHLQNKRGLSDSDLRDPLFTLQDQRHIDREEINIWELETMKNFLAKYGSKITAMRLNFLELPLSPEAVSFFESLPNLEHLTIYEVYKKAVKGERTRNTAGTMVIPECLRRLKTLSVRTIEVRNDSRSMPPQFPIFERLLEASSSSLESLKHPLYMRSTMLEVPKGGVFGVVTRIIRRQNDHPSLQFYDLEEFGLDYGHEEEYVGLYRLMTTCERNKVKLLNVNAEMIHGMLNLRDRAPNAGTTLANVLVSLRGLRLPICLLELPHLEKVSLWEDGGTMFDVSIPDRPFERPSWPNLKEVEILVDEENMGNSDNEDDEIGPRQPVANLFEFFFVGIRREKMELLKLSLSESTFPRARDIWTSCPNLKKLDIQDWAETNNAISKLWVHLPLLKELKLDRCSDLGNVAFVGKDINDPSFFKLKNLRSLTLGSFSSMPKITDTLFKVVLRHMPLKVLHLQCLRGSMDGMKPAPVKNITAAGIQSLLTGVFAETIEEFPLVANLKLPDMSPSELIQLEKQFRSSRML